MLYSCRRGWLVWMPPSVRRDVECIGVEGIFKELPQSVFDDARYMFREMKRIRWSRVPLEHRTLPDFINAFTPVYSGGDRVPWNVDRWRTDLAPDMYIPESSWAVTVERDDPGPRITGSTGGLKCAAYPGGRQSRDNSASRESDQPQGTLRRRYGMSRKNLNLSHSALVSACEKAGITRTLKSLGMPGRPCVRDVVEFLKDLIDRKRILRSSGDDFMVEVRESYARLTDAANYGGEESNRPRKKRRTGEFGIVVPPVLVTDIDDPVGDSVGDMNDGYGFADP